MSVKKGASKNIGTSNIIGAMKNIDASKNQGSSKNLGSSKKIAYVQFLTFQGQQGWAILAPGTSALYAEAASRSLL